MRDVHGVINHISVVEELNFEFEDVFVGVKTSLLEELEEGEDEMPVEIGGDSWCQIVVRHCSRD